MEVAPLHQRRQAGYDDRRRFGSSPPQHHFTEVSYSYEGRDRGGRRPAQQQTLGGACCGMVFGIVLLLGATWLLWRNEGVAVKSQQGIIEARDALAAPDKPTSRGLIHVTGHLHAPDELVDEDFHVEAPKSIRLERSVEVYLWRERADTNKRRVPDGRGGEVTETTTTYSYETSWETSGVNSGAFKHPADHRNPSWEEALAAASSKTSMRFASGSWRQQTVHVGRYEVGARLLDKAEQLELMAPNRAALEARLSGSAAVLDGAHVYSGTECAPPRKPRVGCARVGWKRAPVKEVSIIARNSNDKLVEWRTSAGKGYEIALLQVGEHDSDDMLDAQASADSFWTWAKRGGGLLLVWAGWGLLFGPAQYLASWIPLLSGLVGCVLSMIALGVAIAHALSVIAIAWVAHRPVLAFTLLAIAGVSLLSGIGALRASSRGTTSSSTKSSSQGQ